MKIKGLFSNLFTILLHLTVVSAVFFTNSKDNDYPRIGKRLLPSSLYKTWLTGNEEIDYLPYPYRFHQERDMKQEIVPRDNERLYRDLNDYDDTKRNDLPKRLSDKWLYNKIMTYLNSDDELNF